MSSNKKDPSSINYVHQTAILCETIKKEQKNQKLYTNYSINPFKKMYTLSGKPNSTHDSADGEEDDDFLKVRTFLLKGSCRPCLGFRLTYRIIKLFNDACCFNFSEFLEDSLGVIEDFV